VDRGGRIITPIAPDQVIRANDILVFAGVVSTIVELQRIRGLVPVTEDEGSVETRSTKRLAEAVISQSSPLINLSIRAASFRTVYDAAVIAVHRNGERVPGKIGEIVLRAGDTLLLQTAPGFGRAHRNSPDFYLTSEIEDSEPPRYDRAWIAMVILVSMVVSSAAGILPISIASFVAAGALIITRCISGSIARRSVAWQILIVIGAGLGIAVAMKKTGAAIAVATILTGFSHDPMLALIVVYLTGLAMAELLHHNAAVAIMFPIAMAVAEQAGADPRAFVIAVAVSGCCAFASPVTYQTHLIVYGPGGYRFTDFTKVGLPLDVICAVVALIAIPWFWPLTP